MRRKTNTTVTERHQCTISLPSLLKAFELNNDMLLLIQASIQPLKDKHRVNLLCTQESQEARCETQYAYLLLLLVMKSHK